MPNGSQTDDIDLSAFTPDEPELGMAESTYRGMSTHPVSDEQAKILTQPPTADELEIKPDSFGAVYLSHAGYRRRLNAAFKPRGWAMRRLADVVVDRELGLMYQEWALYAEGHFVSTAIGEHTLTEDMSYGDAMESIKSNALMRCCKDIGIALECWDRRFTEAFRSQHCVKVYVDRRGQKKVAWRRLDAPPIWGELGPTEDSPNRDKFGLPVQRAVEAAAAPPRPAAATPAPPRREGKRTITDKQIKFLATQISKQNVDPKHLKSYIKLKYGIESAKDILMDDFDTVLRVLPTIYDAVRDLEQDLLDQQGPIPPSEEDASDGDIPF